MVESIEKGLIVSIQKYSQITTQELAMNAIQAGAVAIRTDQEIKIEKPVIGLKKLDKEYYITTTREALIEVSRWADYIAIDCRKGNQEIELLLAHCHVSNIKIVADIEKIEDVENILSICNRNKIVKPKYFVTTFSYNLNIIEKIKQITDISIIAEGNYNNQFSIFNAKLNGANNVCIGTAVSDISKLTNKYNDYWNGNLNCD